MGLCDVLQIPVKHLAFLFLRRPSRLTVANQRVQNCEAHDYSSIFAALRELMDDRL